MAKKSTEKSVGRKNRNLTTPKQLAARRPRVVKSNSKNLNALISLIFTSASKKDDYTIRNTTKYFANFLGVCERTVFRLLDTAVRLGILSRYNKFGHFGTERYIKVNESYIKKHINGEIIDYSIVMSDNEKKMSAPQSGERRPTPDLKQDKPSNRKMESTTILTGSSNCKECGQKIKEKQEKNLNENAKKTTNNLKNDMIGNTQSHMTSLSKLSNSSETKPKSCQVGCHVQEELKCHVQNQRQNDVIWQEKILQKLTQEIFPNEHMAHDNGDNFAHDNGGKGDYILSSLKIKSKKENSLTSVGAGARTRTQKKNQKVFSSPDFFGKEKKAPSPDSSGKENNPFLKPKSRFGTKIIVPACLENHGLTHRDKMEVSAQYTVEGIEAAIEHVTAPYFVVKTTLIQALRNCLNNPDYIKVPKKILAERAAKHSSDVEFERRAKQQRRGIQTQKYLIEKLQVQKKLDVEKKMKFCFDVRIDCLDIWNGENSDKLYLLDKDFAGKFDRLCAKYLQHLDLELATC